MTPPAVDEEALRREIAEAARAIHARGWVANHDGNVSARLDAEGRLLCTPTAVSKGAVTPEMLIVVDADGNVVSGRRRAFSELALHRAAYAARPDIGVVLHAHPPTVTGFAVAGVPLGHPFMAEPVVSLGPEIPVVPWRRPGDPELGKLLGRALRRADAVVLDRHGALTVGGSVEQALLRMELLEHLARISLVARQLGGARALPADDVRALSRRGRPPSVPSFGPAPGEAQPGAGGAATPGAERPDVRRVVEEALGRLRR